MTASKIPAAPVHLSKASKAWWRAVCAEYDIEPHLLRVLTAACESWDRMAQARAVIERDGLIVTDRWLQKRASPAVAIERDARIGFARMVRELGLEVGDPDGRPPRVGTGARS